MRQKVDQVTDQRQWKATVTDPDESNAKRASFEITFLAGVYRATGFTAAAGGEGPTVRPVSGPSW